MFLANFCKKKFRTLRERYTRELRKSYLEPSTSVKYEHFKDLSFLSPHIKFRSISFESADGKTIVTKREDISMDKDTTVEEMQDGYFEEPEHVYLQESSGAQNVIYESASVQHIPEYSGSSHQIHEVVQQSDEEHLSASPPKPKDRKRKISWTESNEEGTSNDNNDNKYFAMSVACSLKRLSTINNLKAKVEIYQVLEKFSSKQATEAETRK